MAKKIIFSFLFMLLYLQNFAQQDSLKFRPLKQSQPPPSFWDHAYSGGNFGLQFGTETLIEVSPLLGYKLSDQFAVGIGATYEYYHYQYPPFNFVSSVYGGRIFAEYFIFDHIFAHGEYEILNIPTYDYFNNRSNQNSVLVGAGYSEPFGNNASYVVMILFDVNQTANSIYTNPIFRAGFTFGL